VGFTTPLQDRRFHEVADAFDRRTRRAVVRAVQRGEPPKDPALRPLALLYLERLERDQAGRRKWGPRALGACGSMWLIMGVIGALAGEVSRGTTNLVLGVIWVGLAVFQGRSLRQQSEGLVRSRSALSLAHHEK
jgi:hypothetical protein